MKFIRLLTAVVLAALTAAMTALPAAAEGFTFNWDLGGDDIYNGGLIGAETNSDRPHCKSLFMLNIDTAALHRESPSGSDGPEPCR